jgi:peptide/nickel transport system permease protein
MVSLVLLMALLAPQLASRSPTAMDLQRRLAPPAPGHWLGTDELGRDIWSRLVHGTRISLVAGVVIVIMAAVTGCAIGTLAASGSQVADRILMRTADIFLAFPTLVLAMALVAALGPGLFNAMIAVAVVSWPGYARLIRAQILASRHQAYVESAVGLGARGRRVLLRHILPNCVAPVIVKMTMDAGFAILITASLSFIGLGAQPPTPEWGAMVTTGRRYLLDQWWYPTAPGAAIFVTVLGFSLLGDGLRDLTDPRVRSR